MFPISLSLDIAVSNVLFVCNFSSRRAAYDVAKFSMFVFSCDAFKCLHCTLSMIVFGLLLWHLCSIFIVVVCSCVCVSHGPERPTGQSWRPRRACMGNIETAVREVTAREKLGVSPNNCRDYIYCAPWLPAILGQSRGGSRKYENHFSRPKCFPEKLFVLTEFRKSGSSTRWRPSSACSGRHMLRC